MASGTALGASPLPEWAREFLTRLGTLEEEMRTLRGEMSRLRLAHLPMSTAHLDELFASLYAVYREAPFAAAWVLEAAVEEDEDSARLRGALQRALGRQPTAAAISRLLSRSIGRAHHWQCEMTRFHSRDGRLFRVSNVSKSLITGMTD